MLTGALRNQVDAVWNAFWSGGITNPLEVIEQFTYLLFIKGFDTEQTQPVARAIFSVLHPRTGRSSGKEKDSLCRLLSTFL